MCIYGILFAGRFFLGSTHYRYHHHYHPAVLLLVLWCIFARAQTRAGKGVHVLLADGLDWAFLGEGGGLLVLGWAGLGKPVGFLER